MNYLQFSFETESPDKCEELIALLNEQGFEGFEEEASTLNAFIPEEKFDELAFESMLGLFQSLNYTKTIVENINWNQQWEESFEPVIVHNSVAIRAHFHELITNVEHEIIITPKMSFGTGHHATTYLMLEQMKQFDFSGKSVLDFGTGTGVLAIYAKKLGATDILAIDNDEWSINNARENTLQNGIINMRIELCDEIPSAGKYDYILANINLNVLSESMRAIKNATNPGGTILLSGFFKENEAQMKSIISFEGLQYISTSQRGEWISICVNV